MNLIYAVLVTVYGVIIGSFLNVCIYRIPKKESVVFGRSSCTACGAKIKWYDLLPVLSYIALKGRCRSCKQKISMQYPLVEIANGAAWLCIYIKYGLTLITLFYCILTSLLIVIALIDYYHMMIPDRFVVIIMGLGLIFAVFTREVSWLNRAIGFFAGSIPLLILAMATNGGFGGGDIKLLAAVGFFLGWKLTLLGLLLGIISGAVISGILIAAKIKGSKDLIPFAPFLCIGFFIVILHGYSIIGWYINLF